jgi:hypothetical protein
MAEKNGASPETIIFFVVVIVILGVAHYIQKWTGIPVLDWLDAIAECFLKAIGWLLGAILELIAKILPN